MDKTKCKKVLGRKHVSVSTEDYTADVQECPGTVEDIFYETKLSYRGYVIPNCPACHSRIMISGFSEPTSFGSYNSYICPVCNLKLSWV